MNAIYQSSGQPVSIVSFSPGVDIAAEAKRVIPAGLPYWLVPGGDVDALYAEHGQFRDAWEINAGTIGRAPDGVGEA